MYLAWRSVINMISTQFKKTVIKRLKNDYDIVCHSIEIKDHSRGCQKYSLICSSNRKIFSLSLIVNTCPVDSPSNLYFFNVYSETDCLDCIPNLKEKMNLNIVFESIDKVLKDFSYLDSSYVFRFEHDTVTLLSGLYLIGSSYFEIKSIKNIFSTTSHLKIYNFLNNGKICSNIAINNNKILVSPLKFNNINKTFNQHSIIGTDGLDIFKANLAKSILLFLNENHVLAENHNEIEDDYMSLNYDEIQRYLLVYKMIEI